MTRRLKYRGEIGKDNIMSYTSKAVFFDRDGVINEVIFRRGNNLKPIAPWKIEEFELIPGIKEPITKFCQLGFHLFVLRLF